MKRKVSNRISQVLYLAFLLTCFMANSARSQEAGTAGPSSIPETEIASLQAELVEQSKETSSTSKRRACKSIVRHGEGLIDDFPNAPNRFRILAIMLDSQKRLLRLENTERNRDDIFETCSKLAEAPDEYAEFRLEADLLLSERDLSLKGADLKERTEALKALIQRYRDTPGEAKSLMIAALIAPKLEAFDLERELIGTMTERFPGDPVVIGWRRHNLGVTEFDVLFTGTYTRADGVSISFPIDVMGHTYLIYFWSKETPGIEERLAEVKALQALCPGQLEVFSFNLDDLPDAGENILRALDLD